MVGQMQLRKGKRLTVRQPQGNRVWSQSAFLDPNNIILFMLSLLPTKMENSPSTRINSEHPHDGVEFERESYVYLSSLNLYVNFLTMWRYIS